ncbi:thymidine phosphorylase [Bifidobacterium xylocopae]|uniref:Thymidine phosphorylase n=1 Tax=Bifidobacterium xylocopae TaxID=2493119 RepID=A0A366KDH9_9BIFI|nr:thymidine phosphorylase [Bifidobacterium xylocopae]RBP99437.1 thymidine phosphorylase [Bifidobacterium xylocopae]
MSTNSFDSSSILSSRSGFVSSGPSRPSRPGQLDPAVIEQISGGADPQQVSEMSHVSAASLLDKVHHTTDPEVVRRVVTLVDREGVDIVAELWSDAAPDTLPGILWRLYLLRSWMRRQGHAISELWRIGEPRDTAASAIAGVDAAPDAAAMARTADSILSGAFTGDFALALDRAAAFCEVIARGLKAGIPTFEQAPQAVQHLQASQDAGQAGKNQAAARKTVSALTATAKDFAKAALLWRQGRLE